MLEPTVLTVYFNDDRQWVEFYLHDISPEGFYYRGGGRWGYYHSSWTPRKDGKPKLGKFGEIHLVESRIREDVIAHEVFHLFWDWVLANKFKLNTRNEEKFAKFVDEIIGKFYKEYRKWKNLD